MEESRAPSVFISHSGFDKAFVRRLAGDLKKHGIRTWVDEARMSPGDDFIAGIEQGLTEATHVIIVLSPHSSISSWVREEAHAAQLRAAMGVAKVIPLLLGEQSGADDIPLLLRSRLYVDFRRPEAYQDELRRLLSAFEVSPSQGEVEKAEVLLPRIEEAHVLWRGRPPAYAIEALVINPSSAPASIRRASIRGSSPPGPVAHFWPPPPYRYQVRMRLSPAAERGSMLIEGTVGEPEDPWGRPVTGSLTLRNGEVEFSVSFPLYLEVLPRERGLLRLFIEEFKATAEKKGLKRFVRPPSLKYVLKAVRGDLYIALAGDWGEAAVAQVHVPRLSRLA